MRKNLGNLSQKNNQPWVRVMDPLPNSSQALQAGLLKVQRQNGVALARQDFPCWWATPMIAAQPGQLRTI